MVHDKKQRGGPARIRRLGEGGLPGAAGERDPVHQGLISGTSEKTSLSSGRVKGSDRRQSGFSTQVLEPFYFDVPERIRTVITIE